MRTRYRCRIAVGVAAMFIGSTAASVPSYTLAAHVVVVPRAPVVRVVPRGPSVRAHHYRAAKPSFFWWPWSVTSPCKKGRDGRCR